MGSFSIFSFINAINRRAFASAGLPHQSIVVDSETTISCWASQPLTSPHPPVVLVHDMRKLIEFAVHKLPRFMPEFLLRDALQNLYCINRKEKVELIKGISLGSKNEFQLTQLTQDVLIIWGDHDRISPLDKAVKVKEKLGEKSRLEIVKNTCHSPNTEDPVTFNKFLLNFPLGDPKSLM